MAAVKILPISRLFSPLTSTKPLNFRLCCTETPFLFKKQILHLRHGGFSYNCRDSHVCNSIPSFPHNVRYGSGINESTDGLRSSIFFRVSGKERTFAKASNGEDELNQNMTRITNSVPEKKLKLVFLGTPEVAAGVLAKLLDASQENDSFFEVSAVVTQPPSSRGRGRRKDKPLPSPVAQMALDRNFPGDRILSPESARDENFLELLKDLSPDVCVTAAYGNVLPKTFLSIPSRGTVNIHPSLLPLYRGASPVQRALQDGVSETGVTVAFTVRAMDAGPIIAVEKVSVDSLIKAPELLQGLFDRGTKLLLKNLSSILDGTAEREAQDQDHSMASHASKVSADEGLLVFTETAERLHNTVRAFAGWPGTRASFLSFSEDSNTAEEIVVKIITTRWQPPLGDDNLKKVVEFQNDSLHVRCEDGSVLEVVELQPISKKAMGAKAFWNGLRGRKLLRK